MGIIGKKNKKKERRIQRSVGKNVAYAKKLNQKQITFILLHKHVYVGGFQRRI